MRRRLLLLALLSSFPLGARAQAISAAPGCSAGVACQAKSLALNGATIGTDALGITGTSTFSGAAVFTSGLLSGSTVDIGNQAINRTGEIFFGPSNNSGIRQGATNWSVQLGSFDQASINAQTLNVQNVAAGTSNTAGQDWTVAASQGTGTGVGGRIIFQVAPAGTTGTAQNSLANVLILNQDRTATFSSVIPAVTGTGTPTIVAGSSDTAGEITGGTLATSIVITFATAKANAPFCTVTSQTQLAAFAYTISTTAITITETATTGDKIDYHCFQH